MAAQDVDTRTNTEIEADAMNVLIDVLGGDNDSNIAKTLSAYQIKDPSLIMSLTDEEIGELKINKNNKLSFANGKRLILFKKYFNYHGSESESEVTVSSSETEVTVRSSIIFRLAERH